MLGVPSCLARHHTLLDWNQNAQYACSLGASHPQDKHIIKDCKFCHQQASGDTATDDLDLAEDSDIQSRLAHITQENHTIKVQLSQLTELVWQLLPQAVPAAPQPVELSSLPPVSSPVEEQVLGTSRVSLGLPPPSGSHPRDSGDSPSSHQGALLGPTGQPPATVHSNSLPAVTAPLAPPDRQVPTRDMQLQHPWASPGSPNMPGQGPASGLQQLSPTASQPPSQIPASIRGKVQHGEYIINLSELLVYNFWYRYSSLDDSQALEIIDGKLSLAPKCKVRHLSTLQLWLCACHLYKDTLLIFYPHRYLELSHYQWHIADLDQHFHWAAMLNYNMQFQHKCTVQGLPFSAFNQQLYITALPSMLQLLRCWHADVSNASTSTMRSLTVPFPQGPD